MSGCRIKGGEQRKFLAAQEFILQVMILKLGIIQSSWSLHKCFNGSVSLYWLLDQGEELDFLERQRGVLQKVFSGGKILPIVMVLM